MSIIRQPESQAKIMCLSFSASSQNRKLQQRALHAYRTQRTSKTQASSCLILLDFCPLFWIPVCQIKCEHAGVIGGCNCDSLSREMLLQPIGAWTLYRDSLPIQCVVKWRWTVIREGPAELDASLTRSNYSRRRVCVGSVCLGAQYMHNRKKNFDSIFVHGWLERWR